MALLPQHKFFVYNDKLCNTTDFTPSENEGGIYEVVRVEQGIPLFLEDHFERFWHSAKIANKTIGFSVTNIKQFLQKLIAKNNVYTGNVLIS
ncbi:MAG TPA: aminotransferase class IV, partial [Prolixibacteraceae bacterium]|nr:aminotransferase class IV [Prolixibacteraceae bacterium]